MVKLTERFDFLLRGVGYLVVWVSATFVITAQGVVWGADVSTNWVGAEDWGTDDPITKFRKFRAAVYDFVDEPNVDRKRFTDTRLRRK